MSRVNAELLLRCVDDIRARRRTLEECLAAHPTVQEELRSLIEIAQAIAPPPPVDPEALFRLRGRVALIAAFSAEKEAATIPPLKRFLKRMLDGWRQPPELVAKRRPIPGLIAALAIAFAVTAAGGGVVYASQDALPGDALYQVKTTVESLQLALAAGDEAQAEAHLDLAAKRLTEVQNASERGRPGDASAAAEALAQEVARADKHLAQALEAGKDGDGVVRRLAENLERQQAALAAARDRAPEPAKEALARADREAKKGLALATSRVEALPTPTTLPESTPTSPATDVVAESQPTVPSEVGLSGTRRAPTREATATASGTATATVAQTDASVEGLAKDPDVPGGRYRGLLAKLSAARAALERGQRDVALRIIDGFLQDLNALQRSGHISAENYDSIYSGYAALVSSLGGTPRREVTPGRPATPGRPDEAPESTPRGAPPAQPSHPKQPTPQKGRP